MIFSIDRSGNAEDGESVAESTCVQKGVRVKPVVGPMSEDRPGGRGDCPSVAQADDDRTAIGW